jgi:hypothetical protein
MKRVTGISIFLDESGNSGSNYLDVQQPFFVYGGWFVRNEDVDAVRTTVENWEQAIESKAQEIKGHKLAKGSSGRKKIIELLRLLGKSGAIPIYSNGQEIWHLPNTSRRLAIPLIIRPCQKPSLTMEKRNAAWRTIYLVYVPTE